MTRVLEEEGFTEIEAGTYVWDGCTRHDTFRRSFRARALNDRMIDGVVCCSQFLTRMCDVRH